MSLLVHIFAHFGEELSVGKSGKMLEVFERINIAASSNFNVLIENERGTGKELVASAIHQKALGEASLLSR